MKFVRTLSLIFQLFRIVSYFTSKSTFQFNQLLTFTLPFLMFVVGQRDFLLTFKLWIVTLSVCSFMIAFIGTTTGHHHPKIYHEGDELP